MRLGLDLDHTLISYDDLIREQMIERGWLEPDSPLYRKSELRDHLRLQRNGEVRWQRIQAWLYTDGLDRAQPTPALHHLIDFIRYHQIETWIVSHKTTHANYDPLYRPLRHCAIEWLRRQNFFSPSGLNLPPERVVFCSTLDEKIARITELNFSVFIDDLPEVLLHPKFPHSVRRLQYRSVARPEDRRPLDAPSEDTRPPLFEYACGPWPYLVPLLQEHLSRTKLDHCLARHLPGPSNIAPISGGRNSRAYCITPTEARAPVFLKQYAQSPTDARDRLGTEFHSLSFLRRCGEHDIPEPLFHDNPTLTAAYRYYHATPALETPITTTDIDHLISFLGRLHSYRYEPGASKIPLASEATFTASALVQNLRNRRERFADHPHPELKKLLADFDHTFTQLSENLILVLGPTFTTPLPAELRTLSPSDLGFHNALRLPDSSLLYVDFEYFGWDDPAKLISDFLLQPQQQLSAEQSTRFRREAFSLYGDSTLSTRQSRYEPFFRLKWTLILLNEFLRDARSRRLHSACHEQTPHEEVLETQLQKARHMLAPLLTNSTFSIST